MPNVRFNLKRKEGNEKQLILLIFRFASNRLVYSTGENIPVKFWDNKKMRAKNVRQYPSHALNAYLDRLEYQLLDIYRKLLSEAEIPTVPLLKKELDIITNKQSKKKNEVVNFIEELIEERAKLTGFTKGTVKHYKSVKNRIINYQETYQKDLKFKHINLDFFYKFSALLTKRGQNTNTASKTVKTLKVFLNEAAERGLNKFTDYKSKKFAIVEEKIENTYFNLEEIEILFKYQFDLERLEKVKDLFILGCCTGLRFSDLIRINKTHIRTIGKISVLDVFTGKTKKRVIIPIHPYTRLILEKYDYDIPTITNQKFNQYIKEVCRIAGFTEIIYLTKNKSGEQLSIPFEKCEAISTHTCRRSFITNLKQKGESNDRIKRMTGHTTSKQLNKYDKTTLEENALKMASSNFFKATLKVS